ncbi:MAG: transposase [Planctomycetaceae bacterium]|nr:transposase [Planctomycetaceae bacterium]
MNFDPSQYTYVLVSSTTYGTWLPGDARGYVDEHNEWGTPFDVPSAALERLAKANMKESTVLFDAAQAETILQRWQETVGELDGVLIVVAVMRNHFHFVAVFPGKVTKAKLLQFFKGRASRALNQKFGKRTWWTDSGSVRYSFDEAAFRARVEYVKKQANPLVLWVNPDFE